MFNLPIDLNPIIAFKLNFQTNNFTPLRHCVYIRTSIFARFIVVKNKTKTITTKASGKKCHVR